MTRTRMVVAAVLLAGLTVGAADSSQVAAARSYELHGIRIGMRLSEVKAIIPNLQLDTTDLCGVTGAIQPAQGQSRYTVQRFGNSRIASSEFRDSILYAMAWTMDCDKKAFTAMVKDLEGAIGRHHAQSGNTYYWRFDGMGRRFTLSFEHMVGAGMQVIDVKTVERILHERTATP